MRKQAWYWLAVLLLAVLTAPAHSSTAVKANEPVQAQALLDAMSIDDRVGQLFVITFQGDSIDQNNDLVDLIVNYRIGGVILLAKNDNITGFGEPTAVPFQVANLTNNLQQLALQGPGITDEPPSDTEEIPVETESAQPTTPATTISPAIPLIIATNQEGNRAPHSEFLTGLTQLPSNMGIGATWNPDNALKIGRILGQELSAVGVNLLLGPSLDVLEKPSPFSPSDVSIRSFGGDPYWVGLMGQAFTTGVHLGGGNRVAVIAKHFPGIGSSDRPVEEEVPTVRKSLEQLKQIELAPFFAVTGNAPVPGTAVDGLLITHIRYQGFQGNIRTTTAPVSFDSQALTSLMQLDEFSGWRQNGGVIVSDALGVRAVKRFYDVTEADFPHRRIARDALQAGNDLLYLSDFALDQNDNEAQLNNIRDTILWFRERYLTDPLFQQRVDEAVLRILQLKLRLYGGDFSTNNVLVNPESVTAVIGQGSSDVFDLAQEALTLISPSIAELADRMPSPPSPEDHIVIFTDVLASSQCRLCPPVSLLGKDDLQERILALYGPESTGQVLASQISSFTFEDLAAFLDAGQGTIQYPIIPGDVSTPESIDGATPTPAPTSTPPPEFLVQEAINQADWIIIGMRGPTDQFHTISDFLAQRPDIVRNGRVIVFAFDAPYYLDTTEISKLTAYYGVYSYTDPFLDAAVRALFLESPLAGTSPVDIEGISYNLFDRTQPDPEQTIPMNFVTTSGQLESPTSEEPRNLSVGDTLRIQAGPILDRNGHLVPDGTIVRFIQQDRIQGLVNIIAEIATQSGVAQLDYVLEARTGQFRITAESGEAKRSQQADIAIEEEAQVSILIPTPEPTQTMLPTSTPTSTPTPTPTQTSTPSPTPTSPPPAPQEPTVQINLSELQMLLAFFSGVGIVATLGLMAAERRSSKLAQRIGWPLWGVCGGLLVYIYFALGLPGTAVFNSIGSWAGLFTTLAGGLAGLAVYWLTIYSRLKGDSAG